MNRARPARERGFTLIELLVATTILALIVLMTGSLVMSVLSGSNGVQRHAESDTIARAFLARISYDLQTVAANNNSPLIAIPSSASYPSPSIGFVCASRSANTTGVIPHYSVIYYQSGYPPNETQLALLRGNEPVFWNAAQVPFGTSYPYVTSNALGQAAAIIAATPVAGTAAPTGFDVIPMGTGIVRVTYVLTLNNNNTVSGSSTTYNGQTFPLNPALAGFPKLSGFTSTPSLPATVTAIDLTKVRAITVGIAVLDSTTLRILSSAQLQALAAAIPEPITGQKPLDIWSEQNAAIKTALASLPTPVTLNLRFYQQNILLQ